MEAETRNDFVKTLFGNLSEIIQINTRLLASLNRRKAEHIMVQEVGDIFLNWVENLQPYIRYCVNQVGARYLYDQECKHNARFLQFCERNLSRPESRKLPLPSFMNRPMMRLGRYPILLEALLQRTLQEHADHDALQDAVSIIRQALKRINVETGKADNAVRIRMIHDHIIFKSDTTNAMRAELKLLDPQRQLLRSGVLRRRQGSEWMELDVFLFDHLLLLCKRRKVDTTTYYRVFKNVIPLYLLSVSEVNCNAAFDKLTETIRDVSQHENEASRELAYSTSAERSDQALKSAVDLM